MNDFLDWIMSYLETQFSADTSIQNTITTKLGYKAGSEITTSSSPQIAVQIMDNSEVETYSSFEGENISSIPLQFTVYTGKINYNNIITEPQKSSMILGEKIKNILNKLRESVVNNNIKRCRISSMSPALPLSDGSKIYSTAIRCEFWIANPYDTENI